MPTTLTRAGLASAIQLRTNLTRREADAKISALLELMHQALVDGEDVRIAGFGNFTLRDKAARRGRNPHTGETMLLRPRRVVSFKVSPMLRAAINDVITEEES